MKTPRYWVVVASCDHVRKGVEGGFAQACLRFEGEEPCQAFTALGQVVDAPVEHVDMGGGFKPFRRAVAFVPCRDVPIRPLLGRLSFIQDVQRWGYIFRRGYFEVPEADFRLLHGALVGGEAGAQRQYAASAAQGSGPL
jgi:hypothetical protein